jgi:large-conductance mechanosensitive channel
MILIRFFLIGLIVFLIVRSFRNYRDGDGLSGNQKGPDSGGKPVNKKVSKEIGEYIDYEELKK